MVAIDMHQKSENIEQQIQNLVLIKGFKFRNNTIGFIKGLILKGKSYTEIHSLFARYLSHRRIDEYYYIALEEINNVQVKSGNNAENENKSTT